MKLQINSCLLVLIAALLVERSHCGDVDREPAQLPAFRHRSPLVDVHWLWADQILPTPRVQTQFSGIQQV